MRGADCLRVHRANRWPVRPRPRERQAIVTTTRRCGRLDSQSSPQGCFTSVGPANLRGRTSAANSKSLGAGMAPPPARRNFHCRVLLPMLGAALHQSGWWCVPQSDVLMTLAMAVSIGWSVFLLELALLDWLLARHNR